MANSNVPQNKRKAKLRRRRREVNRMAEKMKAAGGENVTWEIRELKKDMRYDR